MFNVIRFYILRFQATSKPGMCFAERCRTRVMQLPRDVLICDYLQDENNGCISIPETKLVEGTSRVSGISYYKDMEGARRVLMRLNQLMMAH
ncbi:hypothetical protein ACSBR2_005434 [Camellia fascicularis]